MRAEDLFHDRSQDSEEEGSLPARARENKVFRVFYRVCTHGVFSTVIIMLIVANTVVLALDRHPIDQQEFVKLGECVRRPAPDFCVCVRA